jgi:hypothetical protein
MNKPYGVDVIRELCAFILINRMTDIRVRAFNSDFPRPRRKDRSFGLRAELDVELGRRAVELSAI